MIKEIITKERIAVVGLGYVGLPTALAFYEEGHCIYGIDISKKIIQSLDNGINPLIDATSSHKIPVSSENWIIDDKFDNIKYADIVLITVPTPVNENKTPNLDYVISAAGSVLDNIDKNKKTIIILESTVYPGVTRRELTKLCNERNLIVGQQVEIAYCPERVNPGDAGHSVISVSRVIGCDDKKLGKKIAKIYSTITSKTSNYVGNIEVAEASKMVENLQRDIDIALSNELSIVLSRIGVDVEEVLSAADTKWNFHRHTPGIGIGGHCIPIDPYYYIELAKDVGYDSLLSKSARKINEEMPYIAADEIISLINSKNQSEGKKILVLGYSYKPELGDTRETPVKYLLERLHEENLEIFLWDPLVDKTEIPDFITAIDSPYQITGLEMIILATAHNEILNLDWTRLGINCYEKIIYDGRRVLNKDEFGKNGWILSGVGIPK